MFLATTPLSIRDEQDIVLLGPWCLEGRGELDLGANRLIDHRLVHAENKLLMNKEVRETVERLLTHLGKRLNALHGQSHSDRYWRIICGRWLLGFADVLYQRWNLIDNALTQFPIDCAGGSALDHSTIAPRRSQDFAHQRISHDWNTQVFTSILEYRKVAIDLFPRERITGGAPVAAKSRLIKT
ncbi:MAG: hypothetical protein EBU84_21175, partial [Actinobacteria bacterium]|nr:hypothetical protein [Actinomycetota bacterium]